MQNTPVGWPSLNARHAMGGNSALSFPFAATSSHGLIPRYSAFDWVIDKIAPCPWSATAGSTAPLLLLRTKTHRPLYSAEERLRRDATGWTTVQGVLAPIQFAVFLVSLSLIVRYLWSGAGYEVAVASVVLKTFTLYLIMITGSIWEKKVFDKYLFAPSFFWEDVFSMLVLALHGAYLVALFSGSASGQQLMLLACAAYASYVINAGQFIMKLRAARLEAPGANFAVGSAK